jgi:hypothetical protein
MYGKCLFVSYSCSIFYYPNGRDAATAHIKAMSDQSIIGRYCLSHPSMSLKDILQFISDQFFQVTVPRNKVNNFSRPNTFQCMLIRILQVPNFVAKLAVKYGADEGMKDYLLYYIGQKPVIDCGKATRAGLVLSYPLTTTIYNTVEFFLEHYRLDDSIAKPVTEKCQIT